ncbi:MAG: hypothetical protein Nkreftii_001790 [Candidatus Nitrospira kreftii]|uniref:Uncharacterized protein n=1 Tax=Candidatus Nitrospira kreftii TaxID=2652173 RepID=A0A7S8FDX7_9BACT|nr:MAG: hypothetical protein Nkreftii_001790 [Candidatus Nitrospira kreftii]
MPGTVNHQDANRFHLMRELIRASEAGRLSASWSTCESRPVSYPILRYLFGWVNDHVIVLEVGEYRCHSGFGRWGSMTPESFALHLRFKQSVPGSIYTT